MTQLALGLRLAPHARFDTFVDDGHHAVTAHLKQVAAGSRRDTIWLAGPPNSGKTHLLQAACRAAGETGLRAIYLSAAESLPVAALEGLASLDLVAIDDVTAIVGNAVTERALFAVVDEFYRGAGALLLAADVAPSQAGFGLADLGSRAAGAIVYRLEPLSDAARATALEQYARLRGIDLDPPTVRYLLERVRRDMRAVTEWLDLIDRESLAAQRRVTLPFVRELLRSRGVAAGPEPGGED